MVGTRNASSRSTMCSNALRSSSATSFPARRSARAPMWKPELKLFPVPVKTRTRIDGSASKRSKVSRRTARSAGSSRLCSQGRLSRTTARLSVTVTTGAVDWPPISFWSGISPSFFSAGTPASLCASLAEPRLRIKPSEGCEFEGQAISHCAIAFDRPHLAGGGANRRHDPRGRRHQSGNSLWCCGLADDYRDDRNFGNSDAVKFGYGDGYRNGIGQCGIRDLVQHPVGHIRQRWHHLFGSDGLGRLVGDRNTSTIEQCPGL